MSEPLLLIGVGGPYAAESECNLAQIAAARPIVLVDSAAPAWARPYLTRHLTADLTDVADTTEVVTRYAACHELRGVLTYMREHLATAARIAESLHVSTTPVASLAACSDTIKSRRLLARHMVPQPRWAEVCDAAAAAAHADLLGYPALIRSCTKAHTLAVQARNPREVRDAYERASGQMGRSPADQLKGVLVEECLDGPRVSAETVVLGNGDIRIAAITRTTAGPPPGQQAIRHCVFAHDSLLHNPVVRQVVNRAVQALSITRRVLSVQMSLTSRGPRVTDVCAHLAGDLIPLLVKRATGVDLARIAAELATSSTPSISPTRQRAAAIQFVYPPATGRVDRLGVSPLADHEPRLDQIVLTQQVGSQVVSGPNSTADDRIAHSVVLGPDAPSCHTALDRMAQYIDIDIISSAVDVIPSSSQEGDGDCCGTVKLTADPTIMGETSSD
ncbi:biotin carboxylase [Streptomyces afghaniensis]|nr:biotin carboxylase [Streptomyces afghaniensis]